MTILLDTSALYALLDEDDSCHDRAVLALDRLDSAMLLTRCYVAVDRVRFELMRRERIDTAFAFDRHFAEQGFTTIP